TDDLINRANRAYTTKTSDLLITALALALQEYMGASDVLLNLEGHGREELFDDVDVTRTVGWFTSSYPCLFALPQQPPLALAITTVKEALRDTPKNGIGY